MNESPSIAFRLRREAVILVAQTDPFIPGTADRPGDLRALADQRTKTTAAQET